MMSAPKIKTVFVQGEINPDLIANSISNHSHKKNTGAHSIFLGQVRDDEVNGKKVEAIDYSCNEEMEMKCFMKSVKALMKNSILPAFTFIIRLEKLKREKYHCLYSLHPVTEKTQWMH